VIWHVALKEFREIRRDGRFIWSSLILVVLLITAIAFGAQRYADNRALRLAAEREDRSAWLDQGKKNPHSAGHYGVYAFKPATPLALFDPGYDDYTGVLQYLEAHKENQTGYKPAADATALQRFGDLSGARVLQLLVPMLIFLMGFGLIASEREEGTFRQLLSIGVPQRTFVWGKALGMAMAIGTVFVPALLAGGTAAWLLTSQGDAHEIAGLGAKVAILAGCYLMFFATLICVALSVSLAARSSASALVGLVAFWIVTAILTPRLGAELAKHYYPTPSVFELSAKIAREQSAGPHAHEPTHPNHIRFRDDLLTRHGAKRIEDLPFNFIGYAMQQEENFGNKVFDRNYGAVRRQFDRQDTLQNALAIFSPFIAIKSLSAALSGTDIAFANDFSMAGEDYRRGMIRVLNDDIMKNAVGLTTFSTEWGYQASADLWTRIPGFDFDPPRASVILSRNVLPLSLLFAWFAMSLLMLGLLSRRPPRVA
jgi:ABC-2 type transport system permease protein